jgi:hypothetical protein
MGGGSMSPPNPPETIRLETAMYDALYTWCQDQVKRAVEDRAAAAWTLVDCMVQLR